MAVTQSIKINHVTLNVKAEQFSQDTNRNTSQVKFTVWLSKDDNIRSFSGGSTVFKVFADGKETESKTTDGFSVTQSSPFQVTTFYRTYEHEANGARSVPFYSSMTSNYGSGTTPTGTLTLSTIAQQSNWGAVSGSGSLSRDNPYILSATINSKNSSHRHNVDLLHAGRRLHTWERIATPSTLTIPESVVNTIIDNSGTSTSTELNLRLGTYSGNTKIGGEDNKGVAVSISAQFTAPIVYKPFASIRGNPDIGNYDKKNEVYLSNYTTVDLSSDINITDSRMRIYESYFLVSGPKYYRVIPATFRGNKISASLAIPDVSGLYSISAEIIDQNRDAYRSEELDIVAQKLPPKEVTNLRVERLDSNLTQIRMRTQVRYGVDAGAVLIVGYRQTGSDDWYEIYREAYSKTQTAITIGGDTTYDTDVPTPDADGIVTKELDRTFTGFSEVRSYEFEVRLVDGISSRIASISTSVGTAKQLLTLNQDKGIGIGKVHEQGVLDVDGSAYFSGNLNVKPKPTEDGFVPQSISIYSPSDYAAEIQYRKVGGETNARLGYFFDKSNTFGVSNMVGNLQLWSSVGDVHLRTNTSNYVTIADKATQGYHTRVSDYGFSSGNGRYQKFYNGVMICWHEMSIRTSSNRSSFATWNFPAEFSTTTGLVTLASKTNYTGAFRYTNGSVGISVVDRLSAQAVFSYASSDSNVSGQDMDIQVIAIGRWR